MKTNPLKKKLRAGQPTFGTWLTTDNVHVARLLARMGFDWLTLDLEHSAIDWAAAATIFAAVADAGCVPLGRVPDGNYLCVKRMLDAGAWGIVVPMINTPEQARMVIAAAKYPPVGNRSAGGMTHAMNFGASPEEYFERANDEILVVLQAESPTAVDNAEAIARLRGCDAIFIGPTDLRFTMRAGDGAFPSPAAHEALVQRVIDIGKRVGTPIGIHAGSAQDALKRAGQGMQMLALGTDLQMLAAQAREIVSQLRPARGD